MMRICGYCMSNLNKLRHYAPKKMKEEPKTIRPFQHPTNPLTKRIDVLLPQKQERFITDNYETPNQIYSRDEKSNDIENSITQNMLLTKPTKTPSVLLEEQKFLAASIIGPPNSGKSTFLNYMVGQPVSAVSNKSNTTINEIRGIHTDLSSGVQIELIDTPGVTKRYKFSKHFVTRAWNVIEDTNMVIIMIDAIKTLDISMKQVMERLNTIKVDQEELKHYYRGEQPKQSQELPIPKVLVFNKMDLCFNKKKLKWLQTELEDLGKYDKVFYISSTTGYGIDELKQYLYQQSYKCPWRYDENMKNPSTPIDQVEQIIRSAIFKRFYEEIPFIIGIQVREFRVTNKEQASIQIQLNVQRDSQAGIVIGHEGRTLAQVKNEIEIQMAQVYKKRFQIRLQVTIKEGDKQIEFDAEKEDRMEHAQYAEDSIRQQEKEKRRDLITRFQNFLKM